jgi:hypothetical protein
MRWLFQNGPLDEEDRRKIQLQEGPLSDPTLCRLTSKTREDMNFVVIVVVIIKNYPNNNNDEIHAPSTKVMEVFNNFNNQPCVRPS